MIERHTIQAPLFESLRITPRDPNVRPGDRKALGDQALAVFLRLDEGPATVLELEALTGSRRVAARVDDIKKYLVMIGDDRYVTGHFCNDKSRVYVYEMKKKGLA